jgi:prophage antirepressor-like protein
MTHIEMFSNGEFELHVVPEGDGFKVSAAGVARGLAFRDALTMIRSLPESCRSKGYANSRTPRDQENWYLTEAGLYRAVGQRTTSRIKDPVQRATVERFQSWIFDEVLPSLRRTGTYTIPTRTDAHEFFEPHTLTWDEACAVVRQRYGIPLGANELTRSLRTAGVLKQTGVPKTPTYQRLPESTERQGFSEPSSN